MFSGLNLTIAVLWTVLSSEFIGKKLVGFVVIIGFLEGGVVWF